MSNPSVIFIPDPYEIDELLRFLRKEIVDGVRHGFFEYGISCEIDKGVRRKLIIRTGKSYRFFLQAKNEKSPIKEPGK